MRSDSQIGLQITAVSDLNFKFEIFLTVISEIENYDRLYRFLQ